MKGMMAMGSLLLFSAGTHAPAEEPAKLCFDFSKPNRTPLKPEPRMYPPVGAEITERGRKEMADSKDRVAWASVQGSVHLPLSSVLKKLEDPMITRNPANTRTTVKVLPSEGSLLKESIQVSVKPIFFLTLEWEEEWMYTLLEGTPADPKKALISYQKTSGTSHIRRFCGSILLTKTGPELTGMSLNEEILADRRGPEEVADGLLGTLRTLQK